MRVSVDKSLKGEFTELYGEQCFISEKDSKYTADIPFSDNEYSYRILMGFADKCEILEPKNIRNEFISRIKKVCMSKWKNFTSKFCSSCWKLIIPSWVVYKSKNLKIMISTKIIFIFILSFLKLF